jgi:hypothetical protein
MLGRASVKGCATRSGIRNVGRTRRRRCRNRTRSRYALQKSLADVGVDTGPCPWGSRISDQEHYVSPQCVQTCRSGLGTERQQWVDFTHPSPGLLVTGPRWFSAPASWRPAEHGKTQAHAEAEAPPFQGAQHLLAKLRVTDRADDANACTGALRVGSHAVVVAA